MEGNQTAEEQTSEGSQLREKNEINAYKESKKYLSIQSGCSIEKKKQRNKISENNEMMRMERRPTIISPTGHIRSYTFRSFLALILAGCLLSLVAGYINTICLVGFFQTSLSASTGTTSKMLIELAKGNFGITLHFFLVIFSFVLGSFISAALAGGSSFRIERSYGLVLLLESFALAFGYKFEKTTLNLIGSSASLQVGAYLVSFACGLQNGMCTTFSGAVIRTTHVTGILTDIGLILGQAIFYPRTRKHIWKLKVLLPLYGTFCIGGVIGWFAYQILLIKAILLPCAVVGILGITHFGYYKIILMCKTKQINKKHWKRNLKNRTPVPTIDPDANTNSAFDEQTNQINEHHNEDQQNEIEKTSEFQEPFDLQIVSVHNTKPDAIQS